VSVDARSVQAASGGAFVSDICGCHRRLRRIWLGASFAWVWFPNLGGILSVCGAVDGGGCGAVDAGLPPHVSSRLRHSRVEAHFLCGLVLLIGCLVLIGCILW
jgi:hypothetical protein